MPQAVCEVETPGNFQEETARKRVRRDACGLRRPHGSTQSRGGSLEPHEEGTLGPRSQGALAGADGTQQQQESWWEVNKNGPQRPCREL